MFPHARALCRQLSGRSARGLPFATRRKKHPLARNAHRHTHVTSASATAKRCLGLRSSPSTPSVAGAVRTLSHGASKPTPSATPADPPSLSHTVYEQLHLLLRSLRALLCVDLPVLLPRTAALVGILYATSEYGVKIFHCEGPSMEPTIIDGSYTGVLLDRWSHRLFGLDDDGEPAEPRDGADADRDRDARSGDGWRTLLAGAWEQHGASGLRRGDVVILQHPHKDATVCKRLLGLPGDAIVRADGGGPVRVPPGHLWLEGDNPRRSLDSRSYGAVPASLVLGKVICRLWPLREYASLGPDANGVERWRRVDARIGRGARPAPGPGQERCNGSSLLAEK